MKKLKKFVLLTIAMLMLLIGCATASDKSNKDYDSIIIQDAETITDDLGFDFDSNPFDGNRKFTVSKNSENEFSVDVNGTEMIIQIPYETNAEDIPSEISDASKKYEKVILNGKSLICKYIDASSILTNKDELKSYINDLPIVEANIKNADNKMAPAMFSYKDQCIYMNKEYSEFICEWMIVHELVHAMSFYTHGCCIENEEYAFNKLNEVMTDIITASLNPKISKNIQSGYTEYYSLIYPYINLFGISSLKAYFYGYDEIYNYIQKDEFDFFVRVIDNYGAENSDCFYNNLILKWYANVNVN